MTPPRIRFTLTKEVTDYLRATVVIDVADLDSTALRIHSQRFDQLDHADQLEIVRGLGDVDGAEFYFDQCGDTVGLTITDQEPLDAGQETL